MLLQASLLLHKLKKAQQSESGTIHIDGKALKACTDSRDGLPPVEVSLSRYKSSLIPLLKLLNDNGLIEYRTTYTQVTMKGWHYWQEQLLSFFAFLAKSIVTPIVVSVLTTLVTLWLSKYF